MRYCLISLALASANAAARDLPVPADKGWQHAATGVALPPVFGTWFQHLGLNPGMWEPKTIGPGYEHNIQLKTLDAYRSKTNIYSGLKYFIEGRPLQTHTTSSLIATGALTGRDKVIITDFAVSGADSSLGRTPWCAAKAASSASDSCWSTQTEWRPSAWRAHSTDRCA